ncbi:MAG: hypothetical protein AAF561_15460 [Planctomycetota bacterium]
MAVRETIQQFSGPSAVIALAVIIGSVLWMTIRHQSQPDGPVVISITESYFTVDDGETYFAAAANQIPPIIVEGEEAVVAYVFRIDGQEQAVYLEKFSEEGKATLTAPPEEPAESIEDQMERDLMETPYEPAPSGRFLKPARDANAQWVPAESKEGIEIIRSAAESGRRVLP